MPACVCPPVEWADDCMHEANRGLEMRVGEEAVCRAQRKREPACTVYSVTQ
jgi:hypothetical protein